LTRLLMLVEGQSEEAFVKATLAPWLADRGVFVQGPTLLWTKRLAAGGGHRGGVGNWDQIRRNLMPLLGDGDAWVTTLLDFYGLPGDVPGQAMAQTGEQAHERAARLQQEITTALGHPPRFIPFVALHEFEAWMFAEPTVVATHFDSLASAARLANEVPTPGGPEAINQGRDTHPKARLRKHFPSYKESSDGPTVLSKIGIPAVRAKCPHFAAWLTRLEALGAAA
jgi:hypothetical protein